MNTGQPGEEQPKRPSFNLPHRWLPALSPEGGRPLHLNADDAMAKILASFQQNSELSPDAGVDAVLVDNDGTVHLSQVKYYAARRKPKARGRVFKIVCMAAALCTINIVAVLFHLSWLLNSVVLVETFATIIMSLAGFWKILPLRSTLAQLSVARLSVDSLTSFAALLAGRRRLTLRQEWIAHLAGEGGHDPATWQKVKQAFGFLVSAIRYRCTDAADMAWTPFDAILRSRTLSNLSVLVPTTAAGCLVLRHEGVLGVVTSAESILAIAAALYGLIRTGRWWRNVKPSEPKAQRSKK